MKQIDFEEYEEKLKSMTKEDLIIECMELKQEIEIFNEQWKQGHIGDAEKCYNKGYDDAEIKFRR